MTLSEKSVDTGRVVIREEVVHRDDVEDLTYASYLKLDGLLDLQRPLSDEPEHDEMLFIVIHQTYELWFKQILHELDHACELLDQDRLAATQHTLDRIRTILKTLVSQVDILETMTPLEFLSFRDRLQRASGFQSSQFREFEFALGFKNEAHLKRFPRDSEPRRRLEARLRAPSLWDHLIELLDRRAGPLPPAVRERDAEASVAPCPELQPLLAEIYRRDPEVALICERLIDLDEGLQEWRYRHVKMVERTIGGKPGTGGSPGVEYLKTTLFRQAFPDLWAVRDAFSSEGPRES